MSGRNNNSDTNNRQKKIKTRKLTSLDLRVNPEFTFKSKVLQKLPMTATLLGSPNNTERVNHMATNRCIMKTWSRQLVGVQIEHQNGEGRGFRSLEAWGMFDDLSVSGPADLLGFSLPTSSEVYREKQNRKHPKKNGPKNRKHPVSSNCVAEKMAEMVSMPQRIKAALKAEGCPTFDKKVVLYKVAVDSTWFWEMNKYKWAHSCISI